MLQAELVVKRLAHQRVREVVHDRFGLGALVENPVRAQLLERLEQLGLGKSANGRQQRVPRAPPDDCGNIGDTA